MPRSVRRKDRPGPRSWIRDGFGGAQVTAPIVIGGNGHSGTRIFAELLANAGVNVGVPGVTRDRKSYDLNVRSLLSEWTGLYLQGGLPEGQQLRMSRQFRWRLRAYFPNRSRPWGFKNPRTMLLLPFYHSLFPQMSFLHVIRDGRDVTLGNVLAGNEEYISAFVGSEGAAWTPEQRMIAFWGRSNERARRYGMEHLGSRYLLVRFEDLCFRPREFIPQILEFASLGREGSTRLVELVKAPDSIGRWRKFDRSLTDGVESVGEQWLELFGYRDEREATRR